MSDVSFRALREANERRQREWDADQRLDLSFYGCAIAGEVGEACNIIKKLERERLGIIGKRASVGELASELADVIIYIDILAWKLGIDLGDVVRETFNKKSAEMNLGTLLAAGEKP